MLTQEQREKSYADLKAALEQVNDALSTAVAVELFLVRNGLRVTYLEDALPHLYKARDNLITAVAALNFPKPGPEYTR